MKIINLISSKSDVAYEYFIFKDGQPHFKFVEEIDHKDTYLIIMRITSPIHLFILCEICDIFKRHGVHYSIKISYLMGMRSDRVTNFNSPFTLKIVTSIINSLEADSIEVLDPYSNETINLLHNYETYNIVHHIIKDICDYESYILPDQDAVNRYKSIYFWEENVITGKNYYDNTGKLLKYDLENKDILASSATALVTDNICDKGDNFVEIADIVKEVNPDIKLDIFVTHTVNLEGICKLSDSYNKVFITNSYADWEHLPDNIEIINITNLWQE